MKYIITESQVERFEKVVRNFLMDKNYDGVNDFLIDYNEIFDAFDVNIFFNRSYFLSLNYHQNEFKNRIIRNVGVSLKDFFPEVSFKLYIHFS